MGVKLMTGATGEQNIKAADDRECLAGITGLDSYVFPTGSQLKATLVDANTVTIGTGAGSLQGSRFRCSTTTTVNIQSGTQGQYRRDIIGLHFSRETSGREGLEFQVLTGEPAASEGAAADPAYTAGDLLKGDAEAFMPLYRVKLSGINAADPEPMFSILTPLATLGDSVSRSYFSSKDTNELTVVAPRDCTIEVEVWYENQWGYGGKDASIALRCPPGLVELVRVDGHIYGGNTIGRSMHALLVTSGARSGKSYTFAVDLVGSGTLGTKYIFARCL